MSLAHRLESSNGNPLSPYDMPGKHLTTISDIQNLISNAIESMEKQRFKEALRHIMGIAQIGNVLLQEAAPWKYINEVESPDRTRSLSALALSWRICSCLAVCMRPFIPFHQIDYGK